MNSNYKLYMHMCVYVFCLLQSKAKIESLGNTDILKLSTVVRKMHNLNSRIEFIDPEVFCADRAQIDRLKTQAERIAQSSQVLVFVVGSFKKSDLLRLFTSS